MSTPLPSQQYQPPLPPQQPAKGSGLGVAALVLGIFSLVICLIPIANNLAYFTGLAAIVLGILGRRGIRPGKGMALAGIITAIIAIIGAIVSTILYVSVLNGVSDAIDNAAKPVSGASASSSSSTTDDTTPADTETTPSDDESSDDTGPTTIKIGQTAEITLNDQDGATVKISKVSVASGALDTYGEKPKNGRFKIVTVAAANSGSEGFDVNPFDWYYLGADGTKYEYGDDNSITSGYDGKDFNSTTLNKGEKTSGTMVFDVPASAKKLVYAPNFDSEPIAIWITK